MRENLPDYDQKRTHGAQAAAQQLAKKAAVDRANRKRKTAHGRAMAAGSDALTRLQQTTRGRKAITRGDNTDCPSEEPETTSADFASHRGRVLTSAV